MQQHTLIPKRRHLVLKETFLAKHCLLVLCIHVNFSSLFSSPLPTTVKNVCCKNTQCWLAQCILPLLFFFSFFSPGVLCIHLQKGCQSQVKRTPFLTTQLTGALTLLNVTSPNCHMYRAKMALCRGHLIC